MPTNHHPTRSGSISLSLPGQSHRARNVISSSGAGVRVKFAGRKRSCPTHCEGPLERDACPLFEACLRIVTYQEQPRTIHYLDCDGVQRHYTPDFEITLEDGSTILVEVKHTAELRRPDVKKKFETLSAHFAHQGQPFVILDERQIRREPRRTNLRRILWQAPRVLPTAARYRHAIRLAALPSMTTLADAKRALAKHHLDPFGAMLRGVIHFDLDTPLQPSTPLFICQESDHAWFQLAPRFGV